MVLPSCTFARQTAAAVLASILGLPGLGCGSGANEDNQAELTRRPRNPNAGEGNAEASQDPGSSTDDESEPVDDALDGAALETEDPPPTSSDESDAAEESPPAQVFAACLSAAGAYEDCDTIYVTMQESEPPRCVQLTIDNCSAYGRRTLSVEAPTRWELVSGSIGTNPAACELGVFNASNTVVIDATGTIGWDAEAPAPTGLELELTLEPSRTGGDLPSIELATSEPLDVDDCPE